MSDVGSQKAEARGPGTFDALGVSNDGLGLTKDATVLLDTLRASHDFLSALRDVGVLDVFLKLRSFDRTYFLRWVAAGKNHAMRRDRTEAFILALQTSALSDTPAEVVVPEEASVVTTDVSEASAGGDRDVDAGLRDERAAARDEASEARDDSAHDRDDDAEAREVAADDVDAGAAADREAAMRDRKDGASDRDEAAVDREAAAGDRYMSARERVISSIDELTGAYRRDAGTLALEREISKSARTKRPLVIAFVDVDGLKATNDTAGHAAGDALLRKTVRTLRLHLRSYDLIVRYGGDEFVCALSDLDLPVAVERFEAIHKEMARDEQGSISVGFAELQLGDTLESLIGRADDALYVQRDRSVG